MLVSTHPAKHCCYTAVCVQRGYDRSNCSAQSCTFANCGSSHNIFYRICHTCKFESEVATLRFGKHVFLLILIPVLSFAPPLHLPPKILLYPPCASIPPLSYVSTSTPSLSQLDSFDNLNTYILILSIYAPTQLYL